MDERSGKLPACRGGPGKPIGPKRGPSKPGLGLKPGQGLSASEGVRGCLSCGKGAGRQAGEGGKGGQKVNRQNLRWGFGKKLLAVVE